MIPCNVGNIRHQWSPGPFSKYHCLKCGRTHVELRNKPMTLTKSDIKTEIARLTEHMNDIDGKIKHLESQRKATQEALNDLVAAERALERLEKQ